MIPDLTDTILVGLKAIFFLFSVSIEDIYIIGSLLGQGNFGAVYCAKNKKDGIEYALKRIPLPFDEQNRSTVQREANALYKLKHKNIVTCFPPIYTFKEGLGCKYRI